MCLPCLVYSSGLPRNPSSLPRFHRYRYIMFLHNSHYGFQNFLYIWYNDHRPFHRSFLFLILFLPLVTFELHLTSNFTERPRGIAASLQSLFYVSIFLYFVLTDCDLLLTSFQDGRHVKIRYKGLVVIYELLVVWMLFFAVTQRYGDSEVTLLRRTLAFSP